ncbi:MAG: MgtC/SapB family protein [Eubacteriales bacterium]
MNETNIFSEFFDNMRDLTTVSMIFRFTLALFCGSVIGYERGKKRHAAGLRTHIIVCIGATSVMLINQYIMLQFNTESDPARMGAQVISGIGFLGAGTIMVTGSHGDQHIKGVTTAAGLWASACMGLAIGIGFYEAAAIMCTFLFLVIVALNQIERYFFKNTATISLYMEYISTTPFYSIIGAFQKIGWQMVNLEYLNEGSSSRPTKVFIYFQRDTRELHEDSHVLDSIRSLDGIICVERI